MMENNRQVRARFAPNPGQNYPHVVVFRVPRLYVDVNRNVTGENAIAEGSLEAEAAWREYHDVIDHVQRMAQQEQQQQQQQEQKLTRQKSRRLTKDRLQQSSWSFPGVATSGRSSGTGLLLDIHGKCGGERGVVFILTAVSGYFFAEGIFFFFFCISSYFRTCALDQFDRDGLSAEWFCAGNG
jgi:hypothetical protein